MRPSSTLISFFSLSSLHLHPELNLVDRAGADSVCRTLPLALMRIVLSSFRVCADFELARSRVCAQVGGTTVARRVVVSFPHRQEATRLGGNSKYLRPDSMALGAMRSFASRARPFAPVRAHQALRGGNVAVFRPAHLQYGNAQVGCVPGSHLLRTVATAADGDRIDDTAANKSNSPNPGGATAAAAGGGVHAGGGAGGISEGSRGEIRKGKWRRT